MVEQWFKRWRDLEISELRAKFFAVQTEIAEIKTHLLQRDADLLALKTAVDPVRSWYDGDGDIEPPPTDVDIARLAVEDLQSDRKQVIALEADLRRVSALLAVERERANAFRAAGPQIVYDRDGSVLWSGESADLRRLAEISAEHDACRAQEA